MAIKMSFAYKGKETPKEEKEEKRKGEPKPKDKNRQDLSYHIRPISNGFIKKTSWYEGDGDKRQYKEEEMFHENNPFEDA